MVAQLPKNTVRALDLEYLHADINDYISLSSSSYEYDICVGCLPTIQLTFTACAMREPLLFPLPLFDEPFVLYRFK